MNYLIFKYLCPYVLLFKFIFRYSNTISNKKISTSSCLYLQDCRVLLLQLVNALDISVVLAFCFLPFCHLTGTMEQYLTLVLWHLRYI